MTSGDHITEAGRIFAGLKKLSMPDDYLAIVDGAMIAAYHLGNALLHKHRVLPDAEHANRPSALDQPIDALPAPIQPAFVAFAALEKLRFNYVRSVSTYDTSLETSVWRHLETMRQACSD